MADEMNEEVLEEIEARASKVPSREWHYSGPYRSGSLLVLDERGEVVASVPREPLETEESRRGAEAIAAFIIHAREDVPALLAEVRRLRRLLGCARAVTAHYLKQVQEPATPAPAEGE